MKKRLMLFFTCFLMGIGVATAQTQQVTGVVITEEDGQPVVGASVFVKNTEIGTITDVDGKFALSRVPSSAGTLVVSFVGLQTQEVPVKPNLVILMRSNTEILDEVMVVAYGTAKKSAFTGSAKVLNSEKLELSQVSSVTEALAGAVPGVTMTSNNGAPGANSSILVRGLSSINAENDPLIVVDGAPYGGDLNNVNPNDVESLTVLKDAASCALYGARGANGVIIITTKQASKRGEAEVTFDAKWGGNSRALQQYDIITSPAQYYEMHYAAMKNFNMNVMGMSEQEAWQKANSDLCSPSNGGLGYDIYAVPEGQFLIGQNGKLNPNATLGHVVSYNGEEYLLTPDDWEDVGTRTGLRQEYNLSISAANEKSSFYTSLGYLNNEGITEKSAYERLTARLRADYQAKSWLKAGGNFSYARYEYDQLANNGTETSSGNIWAFTSQMAPIYPAYLRNADGSIKIDGNGFQMMDYGSGLNAGRIRPWISDANPIMDVSLNTYNAEGNSLDMSGFVDITPIEGLKITANGAVNVNEYRWTLVYNPYYGQFDTTGGTVSKEHDRDYSYNLLQMVSYAKSFGENNFDIMVGHEYNDSRDYTLGASKSKMFSQDNKELSGAVIDGQDSFSSKARVNREGYFGRLQYNYGERVFGSASLRRDASSRFHPDHRWGTFWSAGAAWIVSKESWFHAPWVQELKLKASYGQQGNDNISAYRYTDLFNIENSAGDIGTSFASKGTEDITWETNTNFNAGVEFQLWHNRLSGSVEYYHRKTTDMLFAFSVAPSLGYASYYDNIGDMTNSGVEVDLNVNLFNRRDFKWDVSLNLSTLRNRVTKLAPDIKNNTQYTAGGKAYEGYTSRSYFIGEDLPMYTWRMREYAGVNESGESLWYMNEKDESGNITGRVTTNDYSKADYYVTEESALPKVTGGFGTSFYAYGVDFAINFTYQLGGKMYDSTYSTFMSSPTSVGRGGYNFHKDLLDSWTPENTGSNIPRFQLDDQYSAAMSTRFLTSASCLNIQNINVGYTLPSSWTRKLAISSLRFYLSAENVFYWSKRKGFDPRRGFDVDMSNAATYSPMRTVSGGVTFKF